jgi:hypothetical protein
MELIWGFLRVLWLQSLSTGIAAWLTPVRKIALGLASAGVIAIAAYLLWPSGNGIERAVLEALGQRETITKANIDEEKRDNVLLEEQEKRMQAERDAAAKAPGAAADRIIWRADDPWLRAKRTAKAR